MHYILTVIFLLFFFWQNSFSQWSTDPNQNLPIAVGIGDRNLPEIVATTDGNYVVVWEDERSGDNDIYAQKLDKAGYALWMDGGLPVCNAGQTQRYAELVPDDSGGVIIVWEDFRNGPQDVYAQRLNAEGQPQWTLNGIPISTELYQQSYPQVAPDGNGGAYIVWDSNQNGTVFSDIYAQRVSSDGNVYWSANGIVVSAATGTQREPQIVSDRNSDAYVVWQDSRASFDYPDIYAQKIDLNGAMQWQANGAPVCVGTGEQEDPQLAVDGGGNLFVTWRDMRSGTDIYAQRMNPDGSPGWGPMGVVVCNAQNSQHSPHIISDGKTGCIITWHDFRNSASSPFDIDVYAQRMAFNGSAMWQTNGVRASTSQDNQIDEIVMSDGEGGALICWLEHPYSGGGQTDTYIQKMDSSGARLWTDNGVRLCTATGSERQQAMCSDGNNGAVIVWADERNLGTNDADIYAQYVNYAGEYSNSLPGLKISELYYCGPENNINYFSDQFVELVNTSDSTVYLDGKMIGRVRSTIDWSQADTIEIQYAYQFPDTMGGNGVPLSAGDMVVIALDAEDHSQIVPTALNLESAQWEFYNQLGSDTDNPMAKNLLNINPQKPQDFIMSLASGYIVIADGSDYWQSGNYIGMPARSIIDGVEYHKDSLATLYSNLIVDAGFTGQGIDQFSGKSVQRLSEEKDTNHSTHDFEILPAPTPALPVFIAEEPPNPLGSFHLYQNYPNPFNPTTTIEFYLPKRSDVKVVVYNSSGQKVIDLMSDNLSAGKHRVNWDGRNAAGNVCASGIYIYRLKAAELQLSHKMILLR